MSKTQGNIVFVETAYLLILEFKKFDAIRNEQEKSTQRKL